MTCTTAEALIIFLNVYFYENCNIFGHNEAKQKKGFRQWTASSVEHPAEYKIPPAILAHELDTPYI
jgi:hypothetical protein